MEGGKFVDRCRMTSCHVNQCFCFTGCQVKIRDVRRHVFVRGFVMCCSMCCDDLLHAVRRLLVLLIISLFGSSFVYVGGVALSASLI